ncbi:hypothetical protein HYPSUDRAFT_199628 [Hypholoma sublateritium FD-334 SS-4]|uniref:Uncharacterized protein n=1 Tax=Hypholoma sublateritium (strain FD-334 SS-4) TaxID=945553 RepID=A0A0D2P3I4_HYPSF|nr:hypothetical protein HYPSUDRAFT_199628 [Hypholoma sublateritium FD-334 SS-4]
MDPSGGAKPRVAAALKRSTYLYAFGVVPKLTANLLDYYSSEDANANDVEVSTRPRSVSNATMELSEMRRTMKRSICDLFDQFAVRDSEHPLTFDSNRPLILHLVESMRVKEDKSPLSKYKYDWNGTLRTHIVRHARPRLYIQDSGTRFDDCADMSMQIYALFMPVASHLFFKLFSHAFGDANCSFNIQELVTDAIYRCASPLGSRNESDVVEFRARYMTTSRSKLGQWLSDFKDDSWDYRFETVRSNGMSSVLLKDGCMFAMQLFASWTNHMRNGSKTILYECSLMNGVAIEQLYPPQSQAPPLHAIQARRILAAICQVDSDSISPNNIAPRLPFFLSEASHRMVSGAIYGVDLEMFALGVSHMFEKSDAHARYSQTGIPGHKWMPLNVIGFACGFLLIELCRIADMDSDELGGQDMKHTASLYSVSSSEWYIVGRCVQSLRLIYDSPQSPEGKQLDIYLAQWANDWHLWKYADIHNQEASAARLDKANYYS